MATQDALADFRNIDHELFDEYATALDEAGAVIERNIAQLLRNPADPTPVTVLFRSFHNLKGDAAICRFEFGMQVAHHIESLLMRLREGELAFTAMLGEAMLLALDRLELTVEAILLHKPTAQLRLPHLLENLGVLAASTDADLDRNVARMVENVSGFRPVAQPRHLEPGAPGATLPQANVGDDMDFFRLIGQQLERRSPNFAGRGQRLLLLVTAMNELAGRPANPHQLEAAVYVHDLGMMLLPEPLWLKPGKLSADDWAQIRLHPAFGAGVLARMPNWTEAAEIVAQHHEMPDGKGYPLGLRGTEIFPGAKILAIADAFEAVMLKHRNRGQNISVLRAAAEVNACETQFAKEWIKPFNQAVRKML